MLAKRRLGLSVLQSVPRKRQNEKGNVLVMPHLGIFERNIEILLLEVDLPDIAVFVSDPKFEKRLVGVGPIRLTHGISCKSPCCFLRSL